MGDRDHDAQERIERRNPLFLDSRRGESAAPVGMRLSEDTTKSSAVTRSRMGALVG